MISAKKEYNPPTICLPNGVKIDLGKNEEPLLRSNDIVVPTIYIKVYDSDIYGVRALYGSLTIVRARTKEEEDTTSSDFDLFEEVSVADLLASMKGENNGSNTEHSNKRKEADEPEKDQDKKKKQTTHTPLPTADKEELPAELFE